MSPMRSPSACRSGGSPAIRCTAAARSSGPPARTPGKATCSRSRSITRSPPPRSARPPSPRWPGWFPPRCWETRSCGRGCKGHRDYEWALAATSSPASLAADPPQDLRPRRPGVLLLPRPRAGVPVHPDQGRRQEVAGGGVLPAGEGANRPGPAPAPPLALLSPAHRAVHVRPRAARRRDRPATRHPGALGLSPSAQPPRPSRPGTTDQPEHWRDTGKLPARPGEQPPRDIGLIRVTVPEARKLLAASAHQTFRSPGASGYDATRPAPDGTTTRHNSNQPYHDPRIQWKITNPDCSGRPACT